MLQDQTNSGSLSSESSNGTSFICKNVALFMYHLSVACYDFASGIFTVVWERNVRDAVCNDHVKIRSYFYSFIYIIAVVKCIRARRLWSRFAPKQMFNRKIPYSQSNFSRRTILSLLLLAKYADSRNTVLNTPTVISLWLIVRHILIRRHIVMNWNVLSSIGKLFRLSRY